MKRAGVVVGGSVGIAIGMLGLLLGAASIALGRWDALAFYGLVAALAFGLVAWILRRERHERAAREALMPPALQPQRRRPREPIRLPWRGAVLTFAAWYAATLVVSWSVTGRLLWLDFAAVAPFAAFVLTILTFAGRHIAFRLTAEEGDGGEG